MIPKDTMILVEAIRATRSKLSEKENGFISTCVIAAKTNKLLSGKQAVWLQDIYGRVTGGGNYQPREFIK